FDKSRDRGAEMRALVGADIREVRIRDRDPIAKHAHVAAHHQSGMRDLPLPRLFPRESSNRATQYGPRRIDQVGIRCAREIALLRLRSGKLSRLRRKAGKMWIDDSRAMRPREHHPNRLGTEVS